MILWLFIREIQTLINYFGRVMKIFTKKTFLPHSAITAEKIGL